MVILLMHMQQAHLKKWIEVASSPQKLGQARVVGQVLPNVSHLFTRFL